MEFQELIKTIRDLCEYTKYDVNFDKLNDYMEINKMYLDRGMYSIYDIKENQNAIYNSLDGKYTLQIFFDILKDNENEDNLKDFIINVQYMEHQCNY